MVISEDLISNIQRLYILVDWNELSRISVVTMPEWLSAMGNNVLGQARVLGR